MEQLRVASLFTGCGGMDLGIRGGFAFLGKRYPENRIKVVFANDMDEYPCRIFARNFDAAMHCGDIKDVPSSSIPDHDILVAGFPCQPFSILAQNPPRVGIESPMGRLFMEVNRILRDKQPRCFIVENVKGILSANGGKAFPLILDEFKESGYCVSHKLVNAADFGVPQRRERVFVIGFRKDLGMEPTLPEMNLEHVPLREVLLGPESIDEKYYFSDNAVRGLERSRKKQPWLNKGRAQDRNAPCNTMTAHLSKSSLNSMDPVLKEGGRYRRITPKEVAKIQSFPDDFVLTESDRRQYISLGNAVPPVVMWHVSKHVIRQLNLARNVMRLPAITDNAAH